MAEDEDDKDEKQFKGKNPLETAIGKLKQAAQKEAGTKLLAQLKVVQTAQKTFEKEKEKLAELLTEFEEEKADLDILLKEVA